MQTFFDDGNQHINADCNPDLRLHRDLACAQECLDMQVLLDPFEEQLRLPALPIEFGNEFGLQTDVVCKNVMHLSASALITTRRKAVGLSLLE